MTKLYKFFVLIFVLCSFANAFATSYAITWTSISLSNPCPSVASTYSLTAAIGGGTRNIPLGGLVAVTFPAGTNAATYTGGTYYGTVIPIGTTTVTATTIAFPSPVAVPLNTTLTVVLNNITNPVAGTYTNVLSTTATPNGSAGTDTFSGSSYTINPLSITTGPVSTPLCQGATINVPFTVCGAFAGGNTFTAQLSNAVGSFAVPTSIGTLVGTGSGTIVATIPAVLGTGYLIRVIGSTPIVTGTSNSNGNLTISTPMTYATSAVNQISTNISRNCGLTNAILEIQVVVTGSCTPLSITQFKFSTAGTPGSTNPATDISKAKVFYTAQTQGFTTSQQFGTAVVVPSGAFTVNGVQPLSFGAGTYYFYLTYDVPATATLGDVVDASVTSFVLGGSTIASMTTPDPAGSRP